jgi:hypothetical protein
MTYKGIRRVARTNVTGWILLCGAHAGNVHPLFSLKVIGIVSLLPLSPFSVHCICWEGGWSNPQIASRVGDVGADGVEERTGVEEADLALRKRSVPSVAQTPSLQVRNDVFSRSRLSNPGLTEQVAGRECGT